MGKHAYLISVHNKPNQLKRLIKILDDERNDLYVHIDKKAYDIYNSETIKNLHDTIRKGRIFFLETNIPVSWGQYSQIQSKLE